MSLLITPSLSQVYQGMLTVPNVALQNAMACHVFRLLKLGLISDSLKPKSGQQSSSVGAGSRAPLSTLRFPGTRTNDVETLPHGRDRFTDDIISHNITDGNIPIQMISYDDDPIETSEYKTSPSGVYVV